MSHSRLSSAFRSRRLDRTAAIALIIGAASALALAPAIGCSDCDPPIVAVSISNKQHVELAAHYGDESIPLAICEQLCVDFKDAPSDGGGGASAGGGGASGVGGEESERIATVPSDFGTVVRCRLSSIDFEQAAVQCTFSGVCSES